MLGGLSHSSVAFVRSENKGAHHQIKSLQGCYGRGEKRAYGCKKIRIHIAINLAKHGKMCVCVSTFAKSRRQPTGENQ